MTTAPEQTPAAEAQQSASPVVTASAAVVERKRREHLGRLQEETFLLEAALENAYAIIESQAARITELEGAQ